MTVFNALHLCRSTIDLSDAWKIIFSKVSVMENGENMKRLIGFILAIILLSAVFSVAYAGEGGDNPNSFMIISNCGGQDELILVPNMHTKASFNVEDGTVGVTKAMYIYTDEWELIWGVPGKGVYKNTTFCTWEMDGMLFGGDILIPATMQ